MPDLSLCNPDQIKLTAGITGAIVSNLAGIPFDKFRVVVAQDLGCTKSVFGHHLKETLATAGSAFTGGVARVNMKFMATGLNLYVPAELRESSPFLCSFAVGLCFAPILNVPRMFQLGKVSGDPYPKTFKTLFGSGMSGLKIYGTNTAIFAPGEGLRMMMCFGTKDWMMPRVDFKNYREDPSKMDEAIPVYCGKLAAMVGPSVALIETISALATETISTVQAKVATDKSKSFGSVLKDTITPKYTGRCFISLYIKNIVANTPLFWIMFMADFYTKKHNLLHRGQS